MEDLIAEFAGALTILPAAELGEALKRFVEKDEKAALADAYERALAETQRVVLEGGNAGNGAHPREKCAWTLRGESAARGRWS